MQHNGQQPHSPDTNPPTPETLKATREVLARAKEAREAVHREAEEKERAAEEKRLHRNRFLLGTLRRSCVLYTVFNLLHFLLYLVFVFPTKEQALYDMMLGGISVTGHAVFYAAALLISLAYSLILYRKPPKTPGKLTAYLTKVCVWFTALQLLMIILYGLYLDMMYNPYAVTDARLLLGPSFLLAAACLGFSLCIPAVNRIYARETLPTALRVILHLTITLILAVVFFYLISSGFSSASDLLIFLVTFSLVYLFCCIFYYALRGAAKQEENDEEEYENIYMTDELRRQRAAQEKADAEKKKKRMR
ncbi:MAG: hypothetical protein IJ449_12780 [Clostridia bacterium]|nr:hypothetical protein [Clostridia bacterium]